MSASDKLRELTLNERRLTELVFRGKQVARIDLAQSADMTGASVTRLVSGLMEFDLFKERAQKDGARGQPKKILSLNQDQFCSVGVYLFADRLEAVLADFGGRVLAHISRSITEITVVDLVKALQDIADTLAHSPEAKNRIFLGVGLGLPGNFGAIGSHLQAHEAFQTLDGPVIQDALREVGNFPVFLENDGTATALGEYLFGNHERHSLFLLHIGYGLGGGAVVNGRPFRGHNGNACLPGALFPYEQPRPTLQDLENTIRDQGGDPAKLLLGEAQLDPSSKLTGPWLERASDQLQLACRLITGMFDPPLIVLGGALPSLYLQDIASRLSRAEIEGPSRGLSVAPIVATQLGDLNGPIGAASIPFFRRFFPGSTTW